MTMRVHDVHWRGSTTDPHYDEFNTTSYMKVGPICKHACSCDNRTHLHACMTLRGRMGTLFFTQERAAALMHVYMHKRTYTHTHTRAHTHTHTKQHVASTCCLQALCDRVSPSSPSSSSLLQWAGQPCAPALHVPLQPGAEHATHRHPASE